MIDDDSDMDGVVAELRAEIKRLRALLREVAPKCEDHECSGSALATWQDDEDEFVHYFCDKHHILYSDEVGTEPFELGIRIQKELEETK